MSVGDAWLSVQCNGSLIKPGTQLVAADFALSLYTTKLKVMMKFDIVV